MIFSDKQDEAPYEIIVARLFLASPRLRSVTIATASDSNGVEAVCDGLAGALESAGHRVRVIEVKMEGASGPSRSSRQTPSDADLGEIGLEAAANPERLRAELESFDGVTVVRGGALLKSGPTLAVAARADGVVLVVRRGRTYRSDLERAASIVRSAGGTVLGVILRG